MEDINNQYSEKGEPGQMVSRACEEHQGLPLAMGGHAAKYMQLKGLCGLVRIGGGELHRVVVARISSGWSLDLWVPNPFIHRLLLASSGPAGGS